MIGRISNIGSSGGLTPTEHEMLSAIYDFSQGVAFPAGLTFLSKTQVAVGAKVDPQLDISKDYIILGLYWPNSPAGRVNVWTVISGIVSKVYEDVNPFFTVIIEDNTIKYQGTQGSSGAQNYGYAFEINQTSN